MLILKIVTVIRPLKFHGRVPHLGRRLDNIWSDEKKIALPSLEGLVKLSYGLFSSSEKDDR